MSGPDIFISNGSCFYAAGREADQSFLPCGNWAFGHVHCCSAGEMCLGNNACYSDRFGTTYLAGCSDFHYKHENCPDKKSYRDYPWAGLIYCRPNQWVACKETGRPATITRGDPCECPPATETITAAFTTGSVITRVGRLPATRGGTIEWENGHFPTSPTSASSPTSSSITTGFEPADVSSATTTPSRPLSPSSGFALPTTVPPSSDETLSAGAKAGIGIGSAMGAVLILGALSALWILYRRRRSEASARSGECAASSPHDGKGPAPGIAEMPTPVVPPRPEYAELGPWTMRPELQGETVGSPGCRSAEVSWQNHGHGVGLPELSSVTREQRTGGLRGGEAMELPA